MGEDLPTSYVMLEKLLEEELLTHPHYPVISRAEARFLLVSLSLDRYIAYFLLLSLTVRRSSSGWRATAV